MERPAPLGLHLLPVSFEAQVQHTRKAAGGRLLLRQVNQRRHEAQVEELRHHREAGLEGSEAQRGEGALLRLRVELHRGLGDDAHGALGADEEAVQRGAAAGPGHGPGPHYLTVGQHHLQRADLLAHGAVFARAVPHAVGRDSATHRGGGHAPRIVAQHEPVALRLTFQVSQHHAGLDTGQPVRRPHLQDGIHATQVQSDATLERDDRAHDPGAATVGDHGRTVLAGQPDHCRHLPGGGGPDHRIYPVLREVPPLEEPVGAQRIEGAALPGLIIGEDSAGAHDGVKRTYDSVGQHECGRRLFQPSLIPGHLRDECEPFAQCSAAGQ